MAFANEESVMAVIENTIRGLWRRLLQVELPIKFPRMTYEEAMRSYGSDKPDTRFGMKVSRSSSFAIRCIDKFSDILPK
jgi:aspartyl-tRNA synthetase